MITNTNGTGSYAHGRPPCMAREILGGGSSLDNTNVPVHSNSAPDNFLNASATTSSSTLQTDAGRHSASTAPNLQSAKRYL